MRKRLDLSSGWTSYELVYKGAGDTGDEYSIRPFSDALATSGSMPVQATNRMSLVEELGWPKAQYQLRYGKKKRKSRIVKKDDFIYLLKCTPDCWRLYFYVDRNRRYFVYLHSVCKKQDEEDPKDAVTARQRYDSRAAGYLRQLRFPTGKVV